jgi:hypothetical protein
MSEQKRLRSYPTLRTVKKVKYKENAWSLPALGLWSAVQLPSVPEKKLMSLTNTAHRGAC